MHGGTTTSPEAGIVPPESLSQARAHHRLTNRYEQAGLCRTCAAQAAYGHQLGFTKVNAPCDWCLPVVQAFPKPAARKWRKLTTAADERAPQESGSPCDLGSVARTFSGNVVALEADAA